jgi:hypothetical protein
MSARRPALALLVLASALAALAPAARADWENPPYGREQLQLTAEVLPSGWTLLAEDVAGATDGAKALRAAVAEAAKEVGLPDTEREILVQGVQGPTGATATVALVDVFVEPTKFLAALRAKGEKGGFAVRELASSARLAVVAAPAETREEVVGIQVRAAGRGLAKQAVMTLDDDVEVAGALAKASLTLEPGAALPRLVFGLSERGIDNDESARTKAIAEIKAALSESATPPLEPKFRAIALGQLGGVLLYVKTAEADAEGRDTLKKAIDSPGAKEVAKTEVAGWRYNLACAHGRLKELDPAFAALRAALEVDKETPMRGISHWRKDPDFDNIRTDPRWKDLLKDFGETDETTHE